MPWLKDVVVDIAATLLIILSVILENSFLSGILWGYTGLLLVVKLIVYAGDDFLNLMNKTKTEAPQWFSHLLYAANTIVLLIFGWWYTGGGWALIWLISYLTQRKTAS